MYVLGRRGADGQDMSGQDGQLLVRFVSDELEIRKLLTKELHCLTRVVLLVNWPLHTRALCLCTHKSLGTGRDLEAIDSNHIH